MAKVKLNFQRFSITEKLARARLIVEKMTANAASFPNPMPALAAVTAAIDAAEQAHQNALEARALSKQRTAALEELEEDLDEMVRRLMGYVESASAGREDVILSAGMEVRDLPSPIGAVPGVPTSMSPTMGDQEGEIDLSWNAVPYAQSYIVDVSPSPATDDSWEQAAVVTTSSTTVQGLTSGSKYWFRVKAVGPGGQSGWSDPVMKMSP
ncbi:MAG TPA: fibronectin type III domain-containing protein [Pyrinomonadaceae bacterium]|jgi:hypothetical protein